MKGIKEKSLTDALMSLDLIDLPKKEDKKRFWIRAIAEVEKVDMSHSYVYVEKDPLTLQNIIKRDFGKCMQIHRVVEYFPFCYLESVYIPDFKHNKGKDEDKAIKERIQYLDSVTEKKHDGKSLKELDREILGIAIEKQLKVEKASYYAAKRNA